MWLLSLAQSHTSKPWHNWPPPPPSPGPQTPRTGRRWSPPPRANYSQEYGQALTLFAWKYFITLLFLQHNLTWQHSPQYPPLSPLPPHWLLPGQEHHPAHKNINLTAARPLMPRQRARKYLQCHLHPVCFLPPGLWAEECSGWEASLLSMSVWGDTGWTAPQE